MHHFTRRIAEGATIVRMGSLAIFHAILLYGLFERSPRAESIASYLENWPIAELIALVIIPYLMLLTVRKHEQSFLERLLWLPAMLLVLGGIVGTLRFLRATWFYVATCLPVLLVEHTSDEATRGCARSLANVVVLVILLGVFANRPMQFPIGTIAGKWMTPEVRNLANSMAFATVYFTVTAVIDFFIQRAVNRGRPTAVA